MNAHQDVHIDVPSEQFSNWMFYYTHDSYVDAHQYAHFDVSSDYLTSWMFYYTHYTHHSYMDIH